MTAGSESVLWLCVFLASVFPPWIRAAAPAARPGPAQVGPGVPGRVTTFDYYLAKGRKFSVQVLVEELPKKPGIRISPTDHNDLLNTFRRFPPALI